jgi:hypothetical protein
MTDGSYLLMAYPPRESVAFVARDDAALLRQALAEASEVGGSVSRPSERISSYDFSEPGDMCG